MYNIVFFDLDGTLTESAPGITNSVAHALAKWNIEVEDLSQLNCFVGPPLKESFMKYYDFSEEDAIKAVGEFRAYYAVKGLFENDVYDGVRELLEKIKASGRKVMLATSKPEELSVRILEHFDLMKYFDEFAGATMDEKRTTKSEVIDYLLNKLPEEDRDVSKIVMVGDREHDVNGAAQFGIDCVGVLYGYGDREELEAAGAKYIANTPIDVFDYL